MYGLKLSARSWNRRLDAVLRSLKFVQTGADQCIYYRRVNGNICILAVYVDDILLVTKNDVQREMVKKKLKENFKTKEFGEVNHILGIQVTRNSRAGKISLDQAAYIQEILERFNMSDSNPVSTPLDPNQKLDVFSAEISDAEADEMSKIPYQEAVGALLYVSQAARPYIAYATSVLSRSNRSPRKIHWTAVKRVFRHLKGTTHCRLEFRRGGHSVIEGFSDAEWANEMNNRRSVTGFLFALHGGVIAWCSRKQKTVALSSTEAEYMALSAACQEAL